MKKFLLKTFMALFFVYLPWIFFVSLGRNYYTPIDFASWDFKHKLINDDKFNPKEIVIGDSLAMTAINPKLINPDLYNLAQSGSTLVDAYYYLRKYLAAGKNPRRVFLSFGTTHWQSSDVFREQTIAYGFLKYDEFNEFINLTEKLPLFYSPEEVISIFKNWIPFNLFFKNAISRFRKEITYFDFFMMRVGLSPMLINHVKNNLFEIEKNVKIKKLMKVQMSEHDGQHLFEKKKNVNVVNPKVQYDKWNVHPINRLYFEKIITLLSEHKIDIEIVFVPNNPNSWNQFSKAFFNGMNQFFGSYQIFNGNLKYNQIESFAIDKLGDMDHVNEDGMIEFSHLFKARYYNR